MWIVFLVLALFMLAAFAGLFLKAGLKAVRVERGLGLFVRSFNPTWHTRHIRRVFVAYRNACMEEGRPPHLVRLAAAALILAGLCAALAVLVAVIG
jgi:hypothetical protein